jgi:hypothetical protein
VWWGCSLAPSAPSALEATPLYIPISPIFSYLQPLQNMLTLHPNDCKK